MYGNLRANGLKTDNVFEGSGDPDSDDEDPQFNVSINTFSIIYTVYNLVNLELTLADSNISSKMFKSLWADYC